MSRASRVLICWVVLFAAAAPAEARATKRPYLFDRLAFISGGKLYVGAARRLLIPGPGIATRPAFSYDGQWLAFIRLPRPGMPQLWLARAGGSSPRRIVSGAVVRYQWSPSADVLAVQPMTMAGQRPDLLVPVRGAPRVLPHRLSGSPLWSPDGRKLAIADGSRGISGFSVVSGDSVRSYPLPGRSRFGFAALVGWWPDENGVLYWLDPGGCNSCIADGVQLRTYDLRTRTSRNLGITLGYPDWIAGAGSRLLLVKGGGRSAFFGKHLALCLPGSPCRRLPGARTGQISLDPAWAPGGGGAIAFVVAPAWNTYGFRSATRYRRWLAAHVLWTADPDGSDPRPYGQSRGVPSGVEDPEWTRDGRGILFVKDGALWIDSHLGAGNAHPIARLAPAGSLPDPESPAYQGWYYGHMNWHDLFAWY